MQAIFGTEPPKSREIIAGDATSGSSLKSNISIYIMNLTRVRELSYSLRTYAPKWQKFDPLSLCTHMYSCNGPLLFRAYSYPSDPHISNGNVFRYLSHNSIEKDCNTFERQGNNHSTYFIKQQCKLSSKTTKHDKSTLHLNMLKHICKKGFF